MNLMFIGTRRPIIIGPSLVAGPEVELVDVLGIGRGRVVEAALHAILGLSTSYKVRCELVA